MNPNAYAVEQEYEEVRHQPRPRNSRRNSYVYDYDGHTSRASCDETYPKTPGYRRDSDSIIAEHGTSFDESESFYRRRGPEVASFTSQSSRQSSHRSMANGKENRDQDVPARRVRVVRVTRVEDIDDDEEAPKSYERRRYRRPDLPVNSITSTRANMTTRGEERAVSNLRPRRQRTAREEFVVDNSESFRSNFSSGTYIFTPNYCHF
jgi:hypothetical protein